ncbi:MAG: helix-turn-helix domain-containing protein [Gaiellaceae bacterium]
MDGPQSSRELYTVAEAAAALRLSAASVYRRIADGEIRAVRLGTGPSPPLRIPATELRALVNGDGRAAGSVTEDRAAA